MHCFQPEPDFFELATPLHHGGADLQSKFCKQKKQACFGREPQGAGKGKGYKQKSFFEKYKENFDL